MPGATGRALTKASTLIKGGTQTMSSIFRRGILAGAAGTAVLNAATYVDMAVRGRDASSTPEQSVQAIADRLGADVPGDGRQRANRRTALGALLGTISGLGLGVAAAAFRTAGVRLPAPVDAVTIGLGAMAATNGPMVVLGLSDPRHWTAGDWISDLVPHLAFGAATSTALRAMDEEGVPEYRPAATGLIARAALLGVAGGARSSLGPAVPALTSPVAGFVAKATALAAISSELTADKFPSVPDRTAPLALAPRLAGATGGAVVLARRLRANPTGPAVAALAGATAGSFGGRAWRRWAGTRIPDWQAALIEDGVALALATLAGREPLTRA
jgi:uncharacterized membrane protein